MSKIAFLFLTRNNVHHPQIWEHYFKGHKRKISIYCHPKEPEKVTVDWQKKNTIPTLVETGWGFITGAYFELLQEAFKDSRNLKFITISESCVPLVCFQKLYDCVCNPQKMKVSFIKQMDISKYDWGSRIKTQPNFEQYQFLKHYARFCLSRYHVDKLIQQHQHFGSFFNKMHVGDEFFLSLLQPRDYVEDTLITYDNWTDVQTEVSQIKQHIAAIMNEAEKKEIRKINNQIRKISKKNRVPQRKLTLKIRILEQRKKMIENPRKFDNSLLSPGKKKSLDKLRQLRDDKNKNPKTYLHINEQDVNQARQSGAFFWRKMDSSCNISDFEMRLLEC